MVMLPLILEFEWDESKAESNLKKHRVSFLEAAETFYDPLGVHIVDRKHSKDEPRSYWIGKSRKGRLLTTWFTMRGTKVRLIGAAALRKYRRLYEASKAQ